MRWFLVWLILCWLLGIVSGVTEVGLSSVVLVALGLVYWGWQYGLLRPVLVAGVCLVGLGWLRGGVAVAEMKSLECVQGGGGFDVTVENIFRQEEGRTQYVVKDFKGCLLLVTTPTWPRYSIGDRWQMAGNMQLVSELPEELSGYGLYLLRQGIGATVLYPRVEVLEVGSSVSGRAWRWIARQVNEVLVEPEASVVRGMVWGERGAVSDDLEEQLTVAGVRHVLAISGLHVSLVVGGVVVLVRMLRMPKWVELLVLLGLLWGYVWLVGMPVSAVRAGWFWSVFLVGWRGWVLVSWLTALLVTLVVLVSWNPLAVLDVGLQLSVTAVVGIALAVRILNELTGGGASFWQQGVVVAVGALTMTGPITLTAFGQVSWIGVVVNVLVLPMVPLIIGGSVAALVLGLVWQPLGLVVGLLVHWVWWYVDWVTALGALVPGGSVQEALVSAQWLVWWYPVVLMAVFWWLKRRGVSWRTVWE